MVGFYVTGSEEPTIDHEGRAAAVSSLRRVVEFPTGADEALHAEVHRVLAAVVELGGAVGWTHVPEPAETAAWLEAELAYAAAGRGGVAIARVDGRVEALGVWARYDNPVIEQNAEVRKIMVHPGARGRGLAREVTQALEDHAAMHGVEVLLLDARGNNHAAHAVYESLGWTEYGRIPDFVAIGDDRWDRVCYCKVLRHPPGARLLGSLPEGEGASLRRTENVALPTLPPGQ